MILNKEPTQILENAYQSALIEIQKDKGVSFLNNIGVEQRNWVENIVNNCESQKGVVSVLTTSLTKKLQEKRQDVRLHKKEFKGGYSGRTFDTKYVTPFFKEKFKRISMKESGWLSRSLEQPHPFTLDFPGKIKNKIVKESFLKILNDIEEKQVNPRIYLVALCITLIKKMRVTTRLIKTRSTIDKTISINQIINSLKQHFSNKYKSRGASRLPVIAIFSIYEILIKDVVRYKNKSLKPLESHVSADKRKKAIGDIEILDENKNYFEAVEIKHDKPINSTIIKDSYHKFEKYQIKRFFMLTTAYPNIEKDEEKQVIDLVKQIRDEHGCEVIVNGIIPSLKYYLRMLKDPGDFLSRYTNNLKSELSKSSEIKNEHVEK